MLLESIDLRNFRNFSKKTIHFHPLLTAVVGKNSVGKTNLLESIYLLCAGKGLVDQKQEELVSFMERDMSVSAQISDGEDKTLYSVFVRRKDDSVEKTYLINKLKKPLSVYMQQTPPTVFFTPAQIQIIDGRPGRRRKYIDDILVRTNHMYKKNLYDYEAGLKRRNKVLEIEKDIRTLKDELAFWDSYLIERAAYVQRARQTLTDTFNQGQQLDTHTFSTEYLKNEMSKASLEETFERSRILRSTLVGPQRDDFLIRKDGINVHTYGSRSEQRMALFWLILNELNLYDRSLKSRPLLLLDDIFSELDPEHKDLVLTLISQYQTVLTTTEKDLAASLQMPHILVSLGNER